MTRVSPLFAAGLCLLASACSGATDSAGDPAAPDGGAAGSNANVGTGGSFTIGGTASQTGGTGASAGASADGGSFTAGGASATAGTSAGGSAEVGGSSTGGQGSSDMGGSAAGGSASGGETGMAGAGATAPSSIDFSIWQLQLPTGSGDSPTTVNGDKLAAFSDAYFYKADDGGTIFMDPPTGITTGGSAHPRCEMREQTPSSWASTGTNTMTVTGKVIKGTSVTIAQVFNDPDSITLAELQYNSGFGGFELFYEEAKGQGAEHDLKTPIALNTKYTFTMSLTKGVLSVIINGKQVYTHTPSASTLSSKFYFKVGNYDQSATKGAISTTVHSQVEDYGVVVVHK